MSLLPETGDFFRVKNVPPKDSTRFQKECPHYLVVENAASMVGIGPVELRQEFRCGTSETLERVVGMGKGEVEVEATCIKVRDKLIRALSCAKIPLESPGPVVISITAGGDFERGSLEGMERAFEFISSKMKRAEVLGQFREAAFNLSGARPGEEITDDQAIGLARRALTVLEDVATGRAPDLEGDDPISFKEIRSIRTPQQCLQRPR